ncbi:MAG TPA: TIGR01777 family oxidoreductase [Terracidiphilus sp.]
MAPGFQTTPRPLRIVIPGGSGLIGNLLAAHFQRAGHHVAVLTRSPYAATWQTVHWDGETAGDWVQHLEGADVCINLAGRSVNCRYHARNREGIYNSRIHSTRLLGRVIASLAHPPALWLNASTATIYRHSLDREMDESGELGATENTPGTPRIPSTWRFSHRVAREWEQVFFAAETPRTRKVALRAAILFAATPGSPFDILSRLVRLGLGGTQGSGHQFVSWMHETDFLRAVDFIVTHHKLDGPVNLASPYPLPNREFMSALREAWRVPNGLPAPALLLELAALILRTESELVLKSRCVIPGKLLDAGFAFEFPYWPEAAADLVRLWRQRQRS